MTVFILKWLRWRYGGNVGALKPPLGYHRLYCPKPWTFVVRYWVKRAWYEIEDAAFQRYGTPMRDAWEKSF